MLNIKEIIAFYQKMKEEKGGTTGDREILNNELNSKNIVNMLLF